VIKCNFRDGLRKYIKRDRTMIPISKMMGYMLQRASILVQSKVYFSTVSSRRIWGFLIYMKCHGSAIGIVTGYGLDDREVRVQAQQGQEFALLYIIQIDSGVHSASSPMSICDSFPRG
jgi:hypothetical protein